MIILQGVRIGMVTAKNGTNDDDKQVDYLRRISFNIQDERIRHLIGRGDDDYDLKDTASRARSGDRAGN